MSCSHSVMQVVGIVWKPSVRDIVRSCLFQSRIKGNAQGWSPGTGNRIFMLRGAVAGMISTSYDNCSTALFPRPATGSSTKVKRKERAISRDERKSFSETWDPGSAM